MPQEEISDKLTPEEKKQVETIKNKVAAQIAKTGRTVVNVTDLFGSDEDRAVDKMREERENAKWAEYERREKSYRGW